VRLSGCPVLRSAHAGAGQSNRGVGLGARQPRLLVRFLAVTGLRISELVGLAWADIDITARRVKVRRRIREGKVADPKSRYGIRDIPLSEIVVGDLAAHRLASLHSGDADPVFASATGTPLLPENFARRFLKPAAKTAGLVDADGTPWPAFHVLRHTCATNLLRAGVPPKSVQLWLGHHAAAFTLDTYGHLLSDDLPDGEVLDRFVNGEGVNSGSTSPPETTGEVVALPQPKTT
jgi:integrase